MHYDARTRDHGLRHDPFKALVGFGDPSLDFDNTQYGFYVQDDWKIDKLTVNGGIRWDYETNMLNNDYVTPTAIANGLRTACRTYAQPVGGKTEWCIRDLFDVEDYISTGDNRESPSDLFQPRLGLSYDVRGNGQTVVFDDVAALRRAVPDVVRLFGRASAPIGH